jgi:hypothetical protein
MGGQEMRRFRVIDGSADNSLTVPPVPPAPPVPAVGPDPGNPVEPSADEAAPEPATSDSALTTPPATESGRADGLVTARKGYDAAIQTTRKIRQRSLLDFLR